MTSHVGGEKRKEGMNPLRGGDLHIWNVISTKTQINWKEDSRTRDISATLSDNEKVDGALNHSGPTERPISVSHTHTQHPASILSDL